jgi:hypothetical protein
MPDRTLYSAIAREILKKGTASKIKKAEKGAVIPSREDQCKLRALETAFGLP